MIRYMLDTNVLIDIVREPYGPVARTFETLSREEISISIVVSAEARFGMAYEPDARSNRPMSALLESLRLDPFETPADRIYGEIRAELARRGRSLSPNDYLIAAQAIAREVTLVTGDQAIHAAAISGLNTEDWRRPAADQP